MSTDSTHEGDSRARRALRSLTAYVSAAALGASLTVAAAPAAMADEAPVSLDGGSATWGVKQSFRNYIGGPIAGGEITASDGAGVNDDGTFDFPTVDGSVSKEDASGEVSFGGRVVFAGHDYGQGAVLEVHVADPRVEFDGDGSATVYADVTSREFNGANPDVPPGDLIEFGEVTVAELTGAELVVDGDDLAFTSEAGTLHADAVEAFAEFYGAGEAMDPLSFTTTAVEGGEPGDPGEPAHDPKVTVSKTEELNPEGETVTVDGTGFRPGQGVYVALTAAERSADSFPEHHTGAVWLRGADAPGDEGIFSTEVEVSGAYDAEETTYDCVETRCYIAVFNDHTDIGNRDQDVWTPISFATEDDGGDDGDGDGDGNGDGGELPEGDLTVFNGRADWGVKESFRNYIEGNIAAGEISTSEGATRGDDGIFSFTDATGGVNLDDVTAEIDFTGTVLFEGHIYGDADPLLYMSVTDPRVEIDGEAGTLYADVVSKSLTDAELLTYDDVALADLDLSGVDAEVDEGVLSWGPIPAALTTEGVPAFADFYVEGEQLDPISLAVSVDENVQVPGGGEGGGNGGGGEPTPGPGDGEGGGKPGLPNTGTALAGLLAAAAVAVAAGGAAIAVSRRRNGVETAGTEV